MHLCTEIIAAIQTSSELAIVTICTTLAVIVGFYFLVTALNTPSKSIKPSISDEKPRKPSQLSKSAWKKPPTSLMQLGTMSKEELSLYDGNDSTKPVLMAIKGNVYDVTESRNLYGPGGAYALLAGKDTSRALATMSFEEEDMTGDLSGLRAEELDALDDWESKFHMKYPKVGDLQKSFQVSSVKELSNSVQLNDLQR